MPPAPDCVRCGAPVYVLDAKRMLPSEQSANTDIPDGIYAMIEKPIALVTGAGGGIGQEIATTLASHQWTVVVNDLHDDTANKTSAAINRAGGDSMTLSGDIADSATVERLFSVAFNKYQRPVSLLINNAGVQTWASLDELTAEQWQRTISTNLTGCFLMTQRFAKTAPAGSSIVNIGSGCNKLAFPKLVDYSAAKGGVEMFTKSSALELGPRGIRVNCIAPGAIATERTAAETGDYNNSWAELTPLRRIGTAKDVANAVLLLADDKAGFITGQTINVDGGLFSQAIWPNSY